MFEGLFEGHFGCVGYAQATQNLLGLCTGRTAPSGNCAGSCAAAQVAAHPKQRDVRSDVRAAHRPAQPSA